jgi:4-hydroxy-3-methylbut-2-enyl diphosphate reductase IspH
MSHPEIPSILIKNGNDLDTSILENKNHVAIASGASTPIEAIEQVIDIINSYN